MSADVPVIISASQWHELVTTVSGPGDHQVLWLRIITSAAPTFLAFVLGLISAFFLDWQKTRREDRKAIREREEKELSQLNVVSTAMAFNTESLQHLAMLQVLPHHRDSHAAKAIFSQVITAEQAGNFGRVMSQRFPCMITRCPEPYFIEVDLFKEIPFVLAQDPELLKLSGWMTTFIRELKNNLNDRNESIGKGGDANGLDFPQLRELVRVQAMIGDTEAVHCFQLIQQTQAVCRKLRTVVEKYKHVPGPHLKVEPPEIMQETVKQLELIAKAIVPDWPPPEPQPNDC